MKANKKMLIIGAGGAGVTLARHFEQYRQGTSEYTADVDVGYIDTSLANISTDVEPERVFVIPGLDGAGGQRHLYAAPIKQAIPDIVVQFKPADLNIIIFSADGGSGSMLGPMLASQWLTRGQNVILVVVGDTTGITQTKNTINTLRSIDGTGRKCGTILPILYAFNSATNPIEAVNKDIWDRIMLLATLFSGNHEYIDSRDLFNWLHFDKTTDYEPGVAMLNIVVADQTNSDQLEEILPIASMITLGRSLNERYVLGNEVPDYHKTGIVHISPQYSQNISVHYALTTHGIAKLIENYSNHHSEIRKRAADRREQFVIATDVDDDGMAY